MTIAPHRQKAKAKTLLRNFETFFCYFPDLLLSRLKDGAARIFPTTLCHGWDWNSRQQACTALWDLNSGPRYQLNYRDRLQLTIVEEARSLILL